MDLNNKYLTNFLLDFLPELKRKTYSAGKGYILYQNVEDLVQKAILEILKRYCSKNSDKKIKNESHLRGLLVAECKNQVLMELRSKAYTENFNTIEDLKATIPQSTSIDPLANVEIDSLLNKLSNKCKEIFKLYMIGHGYKDISNKLEIGHRSVKRHMTECREHVNEIYFGKTI